MTPLIAALLAAVIAFAIAALFGKWYLPRLRKAEVGQHEREVGPESHLKKAGTPTFGGLIFLLPVTILGVIAAFYYRSSVTAIVLIFTMMMAFVGFMDDYVKVRVTKKGLSPAQKTLPMIIICMGFVAWYLWGYAEGPSFVLPITGQTLPITGVWKLFYFVFAVLFLYFAGNAANLTDGVDGLLATVTIPVMITLLILLIWNPIRGSEGMGVLSMALAGGLTGFLLYNHYPAQVFMGDTGSLATGSLVAAVMLLLGVPWLFLLAGVIYCVEAVSVIIQVSYFKRTGGKRIFLMTPIHHHYELKGWSETKIVFRFTIVTVVGCIIGLMSLLSWLRG